MVGFCFLLLFSLTLKTTYAIDDFPKSHPYSPLFYLEGSNSTIKSQQNSVYFGGIVELSITVDENSTSAVLVTPQGDDWDLESFIVEVDNYQVKNASAIVKHGSDVGYTLTVALSLTNISGVASGTIEFSVVHKGENVGLQHLWLVSILVFVVITHFRRTRSKYR